MLRAARVRKKNQWWRKKFMLHIYAFMIMIMSMRHRKHSFNVLCRATRTHKNIVCRMQHSMLRWTFLFEFSLRLFFLESTRVAFSLCYQRWHLFIDLKFLWWKLEFVECWNIKVSGNFFFKKDSRGYLLNNSLD